MSKKVKASQRDHRRKEKAKVKASAKALYEALIASGANQKRKRGRAGVLRKSSHPCGNIGCVRCFPDLKRAFVRWSGSRVRKIALTSLYVTTENRHVGRLLWGPRAF